MSCNCGTAHLNRNCSDLGLALKYIGNITKYEIAIFYQKDSSFQVASNISFAKHYLSTSLRPVNNSNITTPKLSVSVASLSASGDKSSGAL